MAARKSKSCPKTITIDGEKWDLSDRERKTLERAKLLFPKATWRALFTMYMGPNL